jgi:hypothetical protein
MQSGGDRMSAGVAVPKASKGSITMVDTGGQRSEFVLDVVCQSPPSLAPRPDPSPPSEGGGVDVRLVDSVIKPLIRSLLDGYNACLLTFGALPPPSVWAPKGPPPPGDSSSSGSIPPDDVLVERDVSAIGLTLQELFLLLERESSARKHHQVMLSYVEIENGHSGSGSGHNNNSNNIGMNDLFNPSRQSGHVVQAGGAPTFVEVNRVQEALLVAAAASEHRSSHNPHCHVVLTVAVKIVERVGDVDGGGGGGHAYTAGGGGGASSVSRQCRLHIVELAPSVTQGGDAAEAEAALGVLRDRLKTFHGRGESGAERWGESGGHHHHHHHHALTQFLGNALNAQSKLAALVVAESTMTSAALQAVTVALRFAVGLRNAVDPSWPLDGLKARGGQP